jgi:hypothetical protein
VPRVASMEDITPAKRALAALDSPAPTTSVDRPAHIQRRSSPRSTPWSPATARGSPKRPRKRAALRSVVYPKGTHATIPAGYSRAVSVGPEPGCFRLFIKNIPRPQFGLIESRFEAVAMRSTIDVSGKAEIGDPHQPQSDTSYSNATPSGSCSAHHRSAASSLVKTLRWSTSPTSFAVLM